MLVYMYMPVYVYEVEAGCGVICVEELTWQYVVWLHVILPDL